MGRLRGGAQAEVLILVPTVWPLVFTLGAGFGGGGGAAVFSAGRSITGAALAWRTGAAAGTLFDDTALIAMMTLERLFQGPILCHLEAF